MHSDDVLLLQDEEILLLRETRNLCLVKIKMSSIYVLTL
jgi:hypothetical protein